MTIEDLKNLPTKKEKIKAIQDLFYKDKVISSSVYKDLIYRFT